MRRLTNTFWAALLLVLLAVPAAATAASSHTDPQTDRVKAIKKLHPLAMRGDAEAQYKVALIYFRKADTNRALYWLAKAAGQGHVKAQMWMGRMYLEVEGVNPNYAQSAYWFEQAGRRGDLESVLYLTYLYEHNYPDPEKAAYWYGQAVKLLKPAAERGDRRAQSRLGMLLMAGKGVPADAKRADYWFVRATAKLRKAAAQGDAKAAYRLALYYAANEGAPHPDQVVPGDPAKATAWFIKAAELGHVEAMQELIYRYQHGIETKTGYYRLIEDARIPPEPDKAAFWGKKLTALLRKSADKGDLEAMIRLAKMYAHGQGVAVDSKKALFWMTKAAEKGSRTAQETIAYWYGFGELLPKDEKKCRFWASKSYAAVLQKAQNGDADAQCEMGHFFWGTCGMTPDKKQALQWFHKAAVRGNVSAIIFLNDMMLDGKYAGLDPKQAIELLEKAAERGDKVASYFLAFHFRRNTYPPPDYQKARYWIQKLAEQGSIEEQYELGRLYEQGLGGPVDKVKAYMWYQLASLGLKEAYTARDRLEIKMTPAQIAEAKRLVREWLERP